MQWVRPLSCHVIINQATPRWLRFRNIWSPLQCLVALVSKLLNVETTFPSECRLQFRHLGSHHQFPPFDFDLEQFNRILFGPDSVSTVCPNCRANITTETKSEVNVIVGVITIITRLIVIIIVIFIVIVIFITIIFIVQVGIFAWIGAGSLCAMGQTFVMSWSSWS